MSCWAKFLLCSMFPVWQTQIFTSLLMKAGDFFSVKLYLAWHEGNVQTATIWRYGAVYFLLWRAFTCWYLNESVQHGFFWWKHSYRQSVQGFLSLQTPLSGLILSQIFLFIVIWNVLLTLRICRRICSAGSLTCASMASVPLFGSRPCVSGSTLFVPPPSRMAWSV